MINEFHTKTTTDKRENKKLSLNISENCFKSTTINSRLARGGSGLLTAYETHLGILAAYIAFTVTQPTFMTFIAILNNI